MKTLRFVFALMIVLAAVGFAADVSGKWVGEFKRTGPDGTERTFTVTLDLKADGAKLTGTVLQTPGMGKQEPTPVAITDGQIDGDKISFVTVRTTPRGEFKTKWEATVSGAEMKGTQTFNRGGEDISTPFTAKKQ